ncbi:MULTISPECIES: hypothetical protein [Bacillaceae]|uniref:Molecular chaperone DnaJ n=1 Tax=Evansella alkalicola TaxID=745819 RepID=A0ABS6JWV8_9BACI|nr:MULTISPECIES: hypothetical protein [Bacillaceae]MBU9722566.1 hypothetical protein [Bacillus alkalicola]
MKCKKCNGKALIQCKDCSGLGTQMGNRLCETCAGEKELPCPECKGTGKVSIMTIFKKSG